MGLLVLLLRVILLGGNGWLVLLLIRWLFAKAIVPTTAAALMQLCVDSTISVLMQPPKPTPSDPF